MVDTTQLVWLKQLVYLMSLIVIIIVPIISASIAFGVSRNQLKRNREDVDKKVDSKVCTTTHDALNTQLKDIKALISVNHQDTKDRINGVDSKMELAIKLIRHDGK